MKLQIYVLILISWSPMFQSIQESDIFARNPDNDGQQCLNGEMLFQEYTSSRAKCAMICRPLSDCKQIFYDESTQICMGCLSTACQTYSSVTSYSYVSVNKAVIIPNSSGCYEDNNDRTLKDDNFNSESMTIELCVDYCITQRGFLYAGAENGSECYCGDQLPKEKLTVDSECNYVCKGDATQICGGEWRLSVFGQ